MSSYRISLLVVLMTFSAFMVFAEPRPYFTEPSLSPDRKEIAFVSGGDIWTVPATGGVASLLVSHAANEGRPLYLKRETAKAAPSQPSVGAWANVSAMWRKAQMAPCGCWRMPIPAR